MDHVKIQHVSKLFGDTKAIDDVSINIQKGEFFTLLGPSGCGKTTLLRSLAGFHHHDTGDIYFEDWHINNVPAHKRNIGMVFQNYAIFPHMTVFENVAYGLKARKVNKKEIKERVMETLELVELSEFKDRQPSQLSGGQQQRVSLARAVVIHPGLLLMDEPLSNLDAKLRIKMRDDIRSLQKRLDITTIYVTHDQEEALAVSDRIAVLRDGKIQQIGKPHEIYLSPVNQFVASFIGSTNFIDAKVDRSELLIENIKMPVQIKQNYTGKVIYSIRPEQAKIINDFNNESNSIDGTIIQSSFLGEAVVYKIQLSSGYVLDLHEHSVQYSNLRKEGDKVKIDLNIKDAVIFDEHGEEVLNEHQSAVPQ